MFEPIGGPAPKYTGSNKINPLAAISASQMMLDYLGEKEATGVVLKAITSVVKNDLKSLQVGKLGFGTAMKRAFVNRKMIIPLSS